MKVFMLGWEFPPFISGGLGTACYGLTKALSNLGVQITFVLPKSIQSTSATHVKMLTPEHIRKSDPDLFGMEGGELRNVKFRTVGSLLQPYMNPEFYKQKISEVLRHKQAIHNPVNPSNPAGTVKEAIYTRMEQEATHYSGDMYTEIHRYAASAVQLASEEEFDVIHAHDWMTFPAGIAVAAVTGKPLVVHIHSTEFDRSGEHINQMIYDIERKGMHAADKVIAVSHLTRSLIISRYGVAGEKVEVIYNGVDHNGDSIVNNNGKVGIKKGEKIVLFLGRITMQKGPEYFLQAAKKVLEVMDNVKFVMAGSGDMMHRMIEMAAGIGIGHKVLFTGFLRGKDVEKVFQMADLYVMPSVSEPFGIAPLEALNHDVPVLISKQSGVAEVLTHVLKVDFWDIHEMANKIIAVLRYPPLGMTLREHGNFEVRKLRWQDSAEKCARVYGDVMYVS